MLVFEGVDLARGLRGVLGQLLDAVRMDPLTVLDLFRRGDFLTGLAFGAAGFLVLWLARRRIGWFAVWGMMACLGLWWTQWLSRPVRTWNWAILLGIGAVIVATRGVRDLDRTVGPRAVGAAFALSIFGIWGTVPDVYGARVLLGTTVCMLPAFWLSGQRRPESPGTALALGVVALVVVTEGIGRPGSIVGALGTLGLFLIAPLVLRWPKSRGHSLSPGLAVAGQTLFVFLSGRFAGRLVEPLPALGLWVACAVLVGALWLKLEGLRVRGSKDYGNPDSVADSRLR